ncbi:hypothetical protein V496_05478 [Pseudogymnoascus sp. VKM F-4515 (FW-2607)]|nr:hypothetical protein V496_05478 [Pseudogymnoascus sp. VKM F-4515 (FW-2607)]
MVLLKSFILFAPGGLRIRYSDSPRDLVPSPLNPPRHLTNRGNKGNNGGFVALSSAKATAGTATLIRSIHAKNYNSQNSAVQRVTPNPNAPQDSTEVHLECKGKIQVSYTISEDLSGNRKKNILSRISKKKRDSRDVRLRIGSSYADRWNLRGRREPVQIPDEPSDGGEGTGASTNSPHESNDTGSHPSRARKDASHSSGVVLPPPDPSASALLSAGASVPPNPFARPHPPNQGGGPPSGGRRGGGNGNEIETPVGALPSRFMTNRLLPSPSSFYPDWNFRGGDGNTGYNSGAASSSSVSPHAASRASPQAHPYLYRASQQNPGPENQQMNQLGQGNLQPPNDPRLVAAMNQQAGGNGPNAGIIFPANRHKNNVKRSRRYLQAREWPNGPAQPRVSTAYRSDGPDAPATNAATASEETATTATSATGATANAATDGAAYGAAANEATHSATNGGPATATNAATATAGEKIRCYKTET